MKRRDEIVASFYDGIANIVNSQEQTSSRIDNMIHNFTQQLERYNLNLMESNLIWDRVALDISQLGDRRSQDFNNVFSDNYLNHELMTINQMVSDSELEQYHESLLIRLAEWSNIRTEEYANSIQTLLNETIRNYAEIISTSAGDMLAGINVNSQY